MNVLTSLFQVNTYKISILISLSFLLFACQKEDITDKLNQEGIDDFSSSGLTINSILTDKDGKKWIGTTTGLYSYDNKNWVKYTDEELNTEILCLAQSSDETIWTGTKKGIISLKVSEQQHEISDTYNRLNSSIISDTINYIKEDPFGNTWFCTYKGLYFHNESLVKEKFQFLLNTTYTSISFNGNQYFATALRRFLFNCDYDHSINAITGATQLANGYNGDYTEGNVFCSLVDSDGYLWFGTNRGLTRNKNGTYVGTGDFRYFFGGEKVLCLYEAANRDIWVGKETGISVYDGSEWKNYTLSNGPTHITYHLKFPEEIVVTERIQAQGLIDTLVYSISEDTDGSIWVGTEKGISVFDGEKWTSL